MIGELSMKAIIKTKYGSPDVLELCDVDIPVPNENQVLIKVFAASVNALDWRLMRGTPLPMRFATGLFKPKNKIPGADVSGRIEKIGSKVRDFKIGDEVFGDISQSDFGAFAEYVCATEEELAKKPKNLTFEDVASVPVAAVTALQGIRNHGKILAGQKVLINGASGGVGSFAVQIAKSYGAEITAVCSTNNVKMAAINGADHVIDYKNEDFTKSGKLYDLIIAVNGYHSISEYKKVLTSKGTYVMIGGSMRQIFQAELLGSLRSERGGKKLLSMGSAKSNKDDLLLLKDLLGQGKLKPYIEKEYKLEEVPEAIRYLEDGHAKGKLIINVNA